MVSPVAALVLLNPAAWSFVFVVVRQPGGAAGPLQDGVGAAGSCQRYEEFLAGIGGRAPLGARPTPLHTQIGAFEASLAAAAERDGGSTHVYLLHAGDALVFQASAMAHGSIVPRQPGNAARAIAVFHSLAGSSDRVTGSSQARKKPRR